MILYAEPARARNTSRGQLEVLLSKKGVVPGLV